MPIQTGPCNAWPVDLCCELPEGTEQETIDRWALIATHVLWALSGRRIGPCPVTVRPCKRSCLDAFPYPVQWNAAGPWIPYIGVDGLWRNASVCGCRTDCSCTELCEVKLTVPVASVTEVTVDGVVVPPEAYRVDNNGLLVRTDGECWPTCQRLEADPSQEGTFAVTYEWGLPVDEAAIAAVSALTCHLIKGCTGGSGSCGCRSTRNMTRLSRQGVDFEFADPTTLYAEGRTGIYEVDLWLNMTNPYRLTSPSRVFSSDYRPPRTTTWP